MKTFFKLTFFSLAIVVFAACGGGGDDEPKPLSTSKLVGTWTITTTSTEMIIAGKTYKQYLIDELGLDEEDAEIFDEIVKSQLTLGGFYAEMIFKNDYTWSGSSEFQTALSTGGWDITADEKSITLTSDQNKGQTQTAKITKLTDTDLWMEMDPGITQQPAGAPGHVDYLATIKATRKK